VTFDANRHARVRAQRRDELIEAASRRVVDRRRVQIEVHDSGAHQHDASGVGAGLGGGGRFTVTLSVAVTR
jgi:hypothetical protein